MSKDYLLLDDLKMLMGSNWKDENETRAAYYIAVASAGLRQIFKDHGLSLDSLIDSGETEEILVAQAVAEMVTRTISGSVSPIVGDINQVSQSAGGYQVNISGTGNSLFLKRETARWLGLPQVTATTLNLFGPQVYRNIVVYFDTDLPSLEI